MHPAPCRHLQPRYQGEILGDEAGQGTESVHLEGSPKPKVWFGLLTTQPFQSQTIQIYHSQQLDGIPAENPSSHFRV